MTRSRDIADQQENLGGAVPPVTAGKNAVINGGMDIWQRGTSFTGTGAYFAADRMCFNAFTISGRTVSRQSPGSTLPQFQYCTRVARDSGNTNTTNTAFGQSLETVESLKFAGQVVTLSFYARAGANLSGSIIAYLISGTGTDQNRISGGYTGEAFPIGSTFTPTTSWQRYSYTGTVASTATELSIYFQGGSSGTAGANDWYEITGIQLEIGSVATPFSRAAGTIQAELAACQRYYWRWSATATYSPALFGGFYSTSQAKVIVNIPVTMRTAPTTLDYGGTFRLTDQTNYSDVTGMSIVVSTETSTSPQLIATATAASFANYRPAWLTASNSSTAYLGVSAEL